jgi:hypothetical protein
MSILLTTLLLMPLAPASSDTAPATTPEVGPAVALPFISHGQCMLLPVGLVGANGKSVDAFFVLDSGTSSGIISKNLAKQLGLKPTPAGGSYTNPVLFNGRPMLEANVPLLKFGIGHSSDATMLVANDPGTESFLSAAGADGILGGNFLEYSPTAYDFQNRLVYLFTHSPITAADLDAVHMHGAFSVPLLPSGDGRIFCHVGLTGAGRSEEETLAVDTGATFTQVSAEAASRIGLTRHAKRDSATTFAGHLSVFMSSASSLTVGGLPDVPPSAAQTALTVHGPTVQYPKGAFPDYAPPELGLNVLQRFRVLLDYGSNTMYLLPVANPSASPSGTTSSMPFPVSP